ncbi:RhoGAP domain containing protein [Acanthamoeba castellanii str. Neff]|uniref:RhoGAP domain containing protein n=1 Tax=Acanthamoeba castellanii (strain ATCC 30010 / Neff) TaxID=1257118 RepID=L8HIY0_ACACF|nr:RhoGAP domain containing protein [Acanthamoeba castellanii str. Neff]ELR24633.1 RhoGAP domain containing protein [Acanthamoeba castellanii str. Neff]
MKKAAPSAPVGSLATSPSTLVVGGTDDDLSVTIKLDEKKLKAVPPEWVTRWVEDGAFAASVRVLSLRNNQLRQLPPEIGYLKNLEALHLDNNQLTAWPEEMASLRKLKMLTFEGNDQLKELPFFDQFPELRSLKVTRRVNYRIPIKVAAGGGDAILDYLRTIRVLSERLAPQKLVVSFDPKAHWIPDKDAPGCAECKVRFSVFTWRLTSAYYYQYHCDLCGKNFCFKELSPQKMPIPYLSLSPAEVCTDCHRCLAQTASAFSSSNVNRVRIPPHTSDETLAVSDSGKRRSRPTTPRTAEAQQPVNGHELRKRESEGGQLSPRQAGDDPKGKEKEGTTDDEDDDETSSDDAEVDPRKLLEKWKIQSLAKLREETKRGIELMKKEITEAKDRELRELRRETDILRAELVAEKRRKDRGKQREKIDREVQLQTELAKKKDEVAALQDKLSKANKGREQLQSKLRNIRESTKSMADLRRDSRRDAVAGTGDVQEVSRREELEAREKEVAERERELKERGEQLERARAEREAEVLEKAEISSRITELAKMVEDERAKSERIEAEWSLARDSERVRREQEAKLNSELQERAELEQRERAKSEERLQALAQQLDAAQREKRELEHAIRAELNAKAAERESEVKSESEAKEREWQRRESEAARKIDEEARLRQEALQKLASVERELAEAKAQRGEEEGEQMRQLRERIAQLQAELEQERAQVAKATKALEAQLAQAAGALTQAKNESDEREKRISSLLAAEKERETAKSESEAARRQAEERSAEVERRSQEEKREWMRREDELRAALAEERKRKDDALETIESMTMDLDSARRDSQSIAQRLTEEKRAALVEESAKAHALQATVDQLQGQLNEARSHGASATSAIEARLAAQAQALAAAQAEADQKARRATELEAEVGRLRAKSESDKSESEERAKSAAREHDAEKAKSADLQAKLAALEKELEQSRAQEAQKQASVDAVGQKLAALQSELLAKEQAVVEAREKQELLVAELKRAQSEAADHDKKVVELRESLDAATCRAGQRGELEEQETAKAQAELIEARRAVERAEQLLSQEREQRARFEHELEIAAQKLKATCEQRRRESESSSDALEASVSVVAAEELAELQHKIGNLETLLEAMRDEVKRAHEAEEEADRFKESNEQELHELRELVKEKDNQLRRTRQRMNNRVSQLILGMEEGEGLEALRQQLDEKEKELEEAKAKAVEEGRIQLAKVMKLVEDKAKEMKKMKKQLKEVKKKSKTSEIELEKAQAKILLYEEQLQHEKNGLLGKEKMSLISKIEQLKTHELQLMEELSNMQSRKRAPSFSALPLLKGTTKAKLLGSLSAMPAEDAEQLKKEKKELKEKERKEKEDKKERKRKEKEKEKMQAGKDPKAITPRGLGKKGDKKLPQNPVFGVSLEEIHQKDPSRTVPRVVERLVQYLEEHEVFETEGIFRKSGRNLSIDALRKEFDFAGQGKEDDVSLVDDENVGIHEVAGTLKLFLQMLPEPPLSYQLYNSYIALQDTFESLRREKTEQEEEVCREEYLASLVALLKQLPKANLDLLFYILKFCNKLSKSAEQTKMTSHNLSLIFSPSLCSPEVPDITYQTQMPKLGGMVKTMMDEVFAIEAAVCSTSSH